MSANMMPQLALSAPVARPRGEFVFDVWSGVEYRLTEGPDGSLEIATDAIKLNSETHVAASAIVALCEELKVKDSAFRKYLAISPLPSDDLPGHKAPRQGRCGIRVMVELPTDEAKRIRDFYERELRAKWQDVVERIRDTAERGSGQSEFSFDGDEMPSFETGQESALAHNDHSRVSETEQGDSARTKVAEELSARLLGKSYKFTLEPPSGAGVVYQGQFERPQKEWKDDEEGHAPLYGTIIALSKQPPELKVKAHTDRTSPYLETYVVTYEPTDQKILELAEYFGLPTHVQLEFRVGHSQARTVHGVAHRYNLLSCQRYLSDPVRGRSRAQSDPKVDQLFDERRAA